MDADHIDPKDIAALIQDKYDGNKNAVNEAEFQKDLERLAAGEPLAYVIGWIPFLNLRIFLDAETQNDLSSLLPHSRVRPLIPRPETEWWTEKLIDHLKYKFEDRSFTLLDLCAGSGAIGLGILSIFPNAKVSFGEIEPVFESLIRKNIRENNLDESRTNIRIGNLFVPFTDESGNQQFDSIATNPPYIPETRKAELSSGVTEYEPHNALFSGEDGLGIITQIIQDAPSHLTADGEIWMECDISNIEEAKKLVSKTREATIHLDQYGRERLLVIQ